MLGNVYIAALFAAVILTAVTKIEDTVSYSPWCSCRVSAHFTVLLPRPAPCRRHHRKHESRRLHIVLLLLLAVDVELNPGPVDNLPGISDSNNGIKMAITADPAGDKCCISETEKSQAQSPIHQTQSLDCAGCTSRSSRKAAITCSLCSQRWHTSCARLTIAQAKALSVWHCQQCLGRPTTTSELPTASSEAPSCGIAPSLARLRASTKVIGRIPKAARSVVADSLSTLLNEALSNPTEASWWKFLSFAFVALRAPGSAGGERRRKTLASHIKQQVAEMNSARADSPSTQRNDAASGSAAQTSLARRIHAKCADGDIRAALRLLTSSDSFAEPSNDVITTLRHKHPPAPDDEELPPPPVSSDTPPLIVTEEQVHSAVFSMSPGSSAGLDGIRPLHLRQLLSQEAAESGRRLLISLTTFTNVVLSGHVPQCGRDALFGASLCALRKRDGGLRPIAVGSVYRRLPGRIGARHIATVLSPELRPTQLGVGTPLGCEAAVHAAREYIYSRATGSSAPHVLVKVDVRNAFNTVRRDIFLSQLKDRCPEIYPMAHQAYSLPTPLFIGDQVIDSTSGVQQGDPLGPALFSLAVDRCARALKSPFNAWYLDDATIAGPADVVASDLCALATTLPKLGLHLNPAKCEVAVLNAATQATHDAAIEIICNALPEIVETPLDKLILLGSPLCERNLAAAADGAADMIRLLCTRLLQLDRHTHSSFWSTLYRRPACFTF